MPKSIAIRGFDPKPTTAVLLLAATIGVATGEERRLDAYECDTDDGVATFSDTPCGPEQRRIEVDYDQPDAPQARAAEAKAQAAQARSDRYAEQIALQREIARSEGRINDLQKERDAELEQLRATLEDDAARVTQSIWNQGVSARMQAVVDRYDSEIREERARLDRLLRREAEIGRP
jgi:hypothetical protein